MMCFLLLTAGRPGGLNGGQQLANPRSQGDQASPAFIYSSVTESRLAMNVALHKTGRQTQLNAALMQVYCTELANHVGP
nr:hypothetical protein [Mesorhizobium ciceri]